jgi:hypothetical protein
MSKRETKAEFYTRNAKEGRSVRFDLNLDMRNVPPEVAKAAGVGTIQVKITGGTMTSEDAAAVLALLRGNAGERGVR